MAIYLIVSCSNRKRAAIPNELHLRTVTHGPGRAARWLDRLRSVDAPTRPTAELYGGEHWQIALTLPGFCSAPTRLLVASAGYGLVDLETSLKPYAATLTPGHADSVTRSMPRGRLSGKLTEWWTEIQSGSPAGVGPISEVVAGDPDPYVVVAASPSYVTALADELLAVAAELEPNRVTVISTGDLAQTRAADLAAPVTASIEHHPEVSGTRAALNVNAARLALSRLDGLPPTRHAIEAIFAEELAPLGPPRTWDRRRHSDEEVKAWIRTQFATAPNTSRTRLLERFRDEGRACEQQRFSRLYDDVVDRQRLAYDEGAS